MANYRSWPWTCASVGDGGPYTVDQVEVTNMVLGNVKPKTDGVVFWLDDTVFTLAGISGSTNELLEVYNSSGSNVSIKSGVGMVKGWIFIYDTTSGEVSYNANGGAANAIDIVGLRLDIAAQTVRPFYGRGGVSSEYTLVQTNPIWEVPLARVVLDGSGNLSFVQDARGFLDSPQSTTAVLYDSRNSGVTDTGTIYTVPYRQLKVQVYTGFFIDGGGNWTLRFNGDSGSNYTSGASTGTSVLINPPGDRYVTLEYTIFNNGGPYTQLFAEGIGSSAFGTEHYARTEWHYQNGGSPIDQITFALAGGGSMSTPHMTVWGTRT